MSIFLSIFFSVMTILVQIVWIIKQKKAQKKKMSQTKRWILVKKITIKIQFLQEYDLRGYSDSINNLIKFMEKIYKSDLTDRQFEKEINKISEYIDGILILCKKGQISLL